VSREVEILAIDWQRLQSAYPDLDDRRLASMAVDRGLEVVLGAPVDTGPPPKGPAGRLARLREEFPSTAADVAVHRFDYVARRERFQLTARIEEQTYAEHVALDKDVVPPLKEEARALREHVRRLEDDARRRGIDPDSIEPAIEWSHTLAVDAYTRPRYESIDERRERTARFFRRVR
jgi:hypothetical protein